MTKDTVRDHITGVGIVPAIRAASRDEAQFAIEAVVQAGIDVIEVTMTVPGALDLIQGVASKMPHVVIGAGTVLDVKTARAAVTAGARFLTSPGFDRAIVDCAGSEGVVSMPGALTPTEVMTAWHAGADLVKVFPCALVGGAAYIHALKQPFPDAPLVAAGGVNQQTALQFILAGAAAIGVGTELVPHKAVQYRDERWIAELAHRFLQRVRDARRQAGHK